jgi:hypothetical protein
MVLAGSICLINSRLANSFNDLLGLAIGTELCSVQKEPSSLTVQKWECAETEGFLNATLGLPFNLFGA